MTASVQTAGSADSPERGVGFSGYPGGSGLSWHGAKGFVPEQDASNSRRVVYSASPSEVMLETKTRAFGLLLDEQVNVRGFSRVHIEWGVDAFPAGRSKFSSEVAPRHAGQWYVVVCQKS